MNGFTAVMKQLATFPLSLDSCINVLNTLTLQNWMRHGETIKWLTLVLDIVEWR